MFSPKGEWYDTAMTMFVMLHMLNGYESNVERSLCKLSVSFDESG